MFDRLLLNLRDPILGRFAFLLAVTVLTLSATFGLYMQLENSSSRSAAEVKNIQTKTTLTLLLQKKVHKLQSQFQSMLLSLSLPELNTYHKSITDDLLTMEQALETIEKGGQHIEKSWVNFGNLTFIETEYVYRNPHPDDLSLSAIELRSNLRRISEMNISGYRLVKTSIAGSLRADGRDREVMLYYKQLAPLFNRTMEHSNRLFADAEKQLNAEMERNQKRIRRYHWIFISGLALAAILLISVGTRVYRDIDRLLNARRRAEQSLREMNENLEGLVKRRTRALETEIAIRKKTRSELTEQTLFLTNVLESLSHPFYVINVEDYEVVISNTAARDGSKTAETTCYALTHRLSEPCTGLDHPCPLRIVLETQKPTSVEHTHFDSDGRPRQVEVFAYPIFNEEGKVIQVIEYSLDITEKKNAQKALADYSSTLEKEVEKRTLELQREIEYKRYIEAELVKSEMHFRKIISAVNDVIMIVSSTGVIEYVSPSAESMLGALPEELLGEDVFSLLAPEELKSLRLEEEEFIAFVRNHRVAELRVLDRKGRERIFDASFRDMLEDPDISGIVLTARDVTIRRQMEDEQRTLLLTIEQNPGSIVITDHTGTIEYVNKAFTEISGYSAGEAIGQNPRILNSGQTPDAVFKEMWTTLTAGSVWRGEFINRKKNGEIYTESVTILPIREDNGRISHFVAIKNEHSA